MLARAGDLTSVRIIDFGLARDCSSAASSYGKAPSPPCHGRACGPRGLSHPCGAARRVGAHLRHAVIRSSRGHCGWQIHARCGLLGRGGYPVHPALRARIPPLLLPLRPAILPRACPKHPGRNRGDLRIPGLCPSHQARRRRTTTTGSCSPSSGGATTRWTGRSLQVSAASQRTS